MKNLAFILVCLSLAMIVSAQNPAQQQLTKAIHEEEVNGDLKEAIAMYEGIVEDYPNDRKAVAESLYRIGLSHEKLGNREAGKYYQNVINNYSDQSVEAQMSRERLRAMQSSMATGSGKSNVSVEKLYSAGDFYGTVSHDGRHATFTNWEDANLYYVDMVNNKRIPVTTEGSWVEPMSYADYAIWSPDKTKIAYAWYEHKNNRDVYKLIIWDVKTGNSRIVSEIEDGYIWPVEWTSDGRQILTVGGNKKTLIIGLLDLKTEKHSIYKEIPREGLNLFRVMPTISSDSKYILFIKSGGDNNQDIYMISTIDKKETLISDHSADEWGVKWCKDNNAFLFASDRSGNPAVYKMSVKNGEPDGDPTLIYEGITDSYRPMVITDEGRLIFTSAYIFADIYVSDFNLKEGALTNASVLYEEARRLFQPAWSNSGDKIALIKRMPDTKSSSLIVKDMITGDEQTLDLGVHVQTRGGAPSWSHDDSRVLMEYQRGGFYLVVADLQNESVEIIEKTGRPGVFGPDNSIITGTQMSPHIVKLSLDTRKIDTIFTGELPYSCQALKVSPDQKRLSFLEYDKGAQTLRILNLSTLETVLLWDSGKKHRFGMQCGWLSDNETLIVGLENLDENGNATQLQMYTINIHTKEKKAGLIVSDPNTFSSFSVNTAANKIVYKKSNGGANVWALKY